MNKSKPMLSVQTPFTVFEFFKNYIITILSLLIYVYCIFYYVTSYSTDYSNAFITFLFFVNSTSPLQANANRRCITIINCVLFYIMFWWYSCVLFGHKNKQYCYHYYYIWCVKEGCTEVKTLEERLTHLGLLMYFHILV